MFSGLRQGSTLYVLDKSSEPKVVMGYVEQVSAPHPMYPNYNPNVALEPISKQLWILQLR